MFMDSTDIQNKNGFEDIGRSYKYKFKYATRINVIVDRYGIPISINISRNDLLV